MLECVASAVHRVVWYVRLKLYWVALARIRDLGITVACALTWNV